MIQATQAAGDSGAVPVRAIAFLAAASFVSAATMRVGDPLVPLVSEEFHVTAGEAGIVVTAFAMAYGVCQLLWLWMGLVACGWSTRGHIWVRWPSRENWSSP